MDVKNNDLPGLYQSADIASTVAQRKYFFSLTAYLVLLVAAAGTSFYSQDDRAGALLSLALFLVTLGILVLLRVKRPDDIWYNGRAVAESVKTRAWRWMMRADPYLDCSSLDATSEIFISDLREILKQNMRLTESIGIEKSIDDPITQRMRGIRGLSVEKRLEVYKSQRIEDQKYFYSKKAIFNRNWACAWFRVSVLLHVSAILMLLARVWKPGLNLPIEVIATAAGATLTWLQAKKHNELHSSYSLAAHEIALIKGEALSVKTEEELSDFVLDSETAFSREHTQWVARKVD